ncbi:RtcB family protein [Thermoproteota archaeon]
MNIKKINDHEFMIEKEGAMKVPVKLFVSEKLLDSIKKDKTLQQAMNIATLPGIYKAAMVMPDGHQGYGFPIGGVSAFDVEKGIITPGGIGFDINCGVRLLTTPLTKEDVAPKIKDILESLFNHIPAGVGSHSKLRLTDDQLDEVLETGSKWAVKNGYGTEDDLDCTESNGSMEGADAHAVSTRAKARGRNQLGTLGAGNHFLEIQVVDKIIDPEAAKAFGIEKEGQVTIMIHCGSRGLGHQVCSDFIRQMEEANPDIANKLPDRDLIYAPAGSLLAKKYYKAMAAAANYAWCNRQVITHWVRDALKESIGIDPKDVKQVYDVAHNIAKIEEHEIDGEKKKVYLHRKGATRAFPPGHPEIPEKYQKFGQPVLIPGSMGTASYVLVGTEKGMKECFGSTTHGAGRVMSRHEAMKKFRGEEVKKDLAAHNIYVKAASWKGICEEAPGVYKDVDEVVKVSQDAGMANIVFRVRPFGVIKG